jgi:hypothetical protein
MHVVFAFDLMTGVAHDQPHLGLFQFSLADLFSPSEDEEEDSAEGGDNRVESFFSSFLFV